MGRDGTHEFFFYLSARPSKIGIGDSSMKHANEGIRLGLGSNELSGTDVEMILMMVVMVMVVMVMMIDDDH